MRLTGLMMGAAFAACAAVPALAQDADRDLRIVVAEEVDLLEPCMATQSTIGAVLLQNISETLTYLDVRGESELTPKLAESWTQNDDGSWRFNLRQGVTFSDGSAFDAADVKHSFDRMMSDQIVCEAKRYFGGMEVQATVVDDHTIDFTADPAQPIMPLLLSLMAIVPSETPIEFTREPVGTGPYVLSDWTPGQQIVLSARDDYWGDAPAVTSATWLFRSDPAVRAAMIQTGEADIAPSIAVLDATNPETDFSYLDSETIYILLDDAVAPTNDVRVRQAMNMAIDREAFIGTLLPQDALLATSLFPPSTLGWNPDVAVTPYDPEGAIALLEDARADGVAVDTQMTLLARTANFPNIVEVMEALQQMLQEVGLTVDLRFLEVAEYQRIFKKPFPTEMGSVLFTAMHDNSKGDPSFTMFFKYASEGPQSGTDDPKVDQLIEDASAATDDDRARLWSELQAYLHDELYADVPLFHTVGYARVAPQIDWRPTIATTSMLPLGEIGFK
ncbi:peptide ABC transporter substrate-binding protein [Paracoccus gahaiensis]|uniref:Peptide ABC transporter substrate-binding protein n=1 Tax=Paracoccus gahaiensis TaxID=1706839 RepID=A0A4U0RQS0_9RHOB|nr:ABC transporter substrate-binding protein [Paracoccus gahaiensis]TJZ90594.1 peptide ABC transporter substrate-binding protein [Paracoccus gahaiensis]